MKVLLVEPNYKNKYPPIALMKLSTYHKLLGDEVVFCKGKNAKLRVQKWDRIYITTVFTFHWKHVTETIRYYLKSVNGTKQLYVGGSMANIMSEELRQVDGFEDINIICGLLDKPGQLDKGNVHIIDELIPDYSIIDLAQNKYLNYEYKIKDAYFIHATRGCIRKCEFCGVPKIESKFKEYFDIKPNIEKIKKKYGEKCDLLMMDNNVLASPCFEKIIDDIILCGFGRDNEGFTYSVNGKSITKKRYVDFNQGVDARIIHVKPEIMKQFSRIAIRPLRIAFDHADEEFINIYKHCMELAAENNIKELSNYILFNYEDTPDELYIRLNVNTQLNEAFEKEGKITRIWSFPMRYSPLYGEHARDRKYVGQNWTSKQIRGVQCILNATHGVVGPKQKFFFRAFGKNLKEYNEILWMPEKLIIQREDSEKSGDTLRWKQLYNDLSGDELIEFHSVIASNIFVGITSNNTKISQLLRFYIES